MSYARSFGLGAECSFVNDAQFLGKTREEIAAIMAAGQGIPLSQALADPSISLYTDMAYRERMCAGGSFAMTPVEITTPIEEGGAYTITRAVGTMTQSEAQRLASMVGASLVAEKNLLGQTTGEWSLQFPNGASLPANHIAQLFNSGMDAYAVNQYIQQQVTANAGAVQQFQTAQAQVQAAAAQASQAIGPITSWVGVNPTTGATSTTPVQINPPAQTPIQQAGPPVAPVTVTLPGPGAGAPLATTFNTPDRVGVPVGWFDDVTNIGGRSVPNWALAGGAGFAGLLLLVIAGRR